MLDLLGADSAVSDLMATPLAPESHHLLRETGPAQPEAPDPWIGRILNGFRLDQLLGRGGMGVVYRGTQVEGVLKQQVALKLMARHLQSTPAQVQFQRERDTLASLQHPAIAKMVGGGVTAEHLPFVTMEYIEGRRLDLAAEDASASLRQIVGWMLELCEAVSYVHRNLILHRDLKPGNVMVTSEGRVKLLDFGTLKSIGLDADTSSAMTQAGMRPVTLRYASPEHICGEIASSAVDTYSLGMTLYRLIAGKLPHVEDLSRDGYLLWLEQEAAPPPGSLAGAGRWSAEPALIADLNAIALKAIRYRAPDRYASVDDFARDLRAALQHRPVSARAGTLLYRAGRFLRRQRLLLSSGVAATLILGFGLAAMTHETRIARAESLRADAGIAQERKLIHLLLFDYFDRLKRIPASTDAQRRAVSQAIRFLDSSSQSVADPALQLDTIQAYTELGLLQGSAYEENLGDTKGSIVTLTKAVTSARTLLSQAPGNLLYVQSYAAAEKALGEVYFTTGKTRDALEHLTRATEAGKRMTALPSATTAMRIQAASTVDNLGDILGRPGVSTLNDPEGAIQRYQQAAATYREAWKLDPACFGCARGVVVEDYKLGTVTGNKTLAASFDQDGLAVIASMPEAEQNTTRIARAGSLLRQNLGAFYVDEGRVPEGFALMLTAREKLRAAVRADPLDERARTDLALFDGVLASCYDQTQQFAAEAEALSEFLQVMDGLTHKDPANTIARFRLALAQSRYAQAQLQLGHTAEAARPARESLGVLIPMAQKVDAGSRILSVAADAVVHLTAPTQKNAELAVSFIKRAMQGKQRPEAEDLLLLAEAEHLAGNPADSRHAAEDALKLLPAGGHSQSEANQREAAERWIKLANTANSATAK